MSLFPFKSDRSENKIVNKMHFQTTISAFLDSEFVFNIFISHSRKQRKYEC